MKPSKFALLLAKLGLVSGLALGVMAHADTLAVPLDVSSSTPIVDPAFMRTALPLIADKISTLPIGSRVKVFSVGDDKATPLNIDLWVQRDRSAQGDTAKELSTKVTRMIAVYLNTLRAKPDLMQGESSLSPAFLDASKWCQINKPCSIIYLTDGMEYQPGVISWGRDTSKPLPPIPNLDLKGASVLMYGVGQGVPTQIRIAVEQHWQKWLKDHNAGTVDLRRL